MRSFLAGLIAAGAVLCAGVSNAAVTLVSTDTVLPTPVIMAAPTSNSADFRLNYVGSDATFPPPNSRSPWEGTIYEATGPYNSVEAGGFAEYVFASVQSEFGLMWGSPDVYNTLEFFLGGASQGAFNGLTIATAAGVPVAVGFANAFFEGDFDTVRFTSTRFDAFEYSQVQPVPLPAAGWLFAAALGGMGLLARRRVA